VAFWVTCVYGGGGCCECIRAVGYVCVMGVNDLSCSGCSGLARCVNRCDSEWHWFEVFRLVAVCGWLHMCKWVVKVVRLERVVGLAGLGVTQSGIWVTCVYGGGDGVMGIDVVMSVGLVVMVGWSGIGVSRVAFGLGFQQLWMLLVLLVVGL